MDYRRNQDSYNPRDYRYTEEYGQPARSRSNRRSDEPRRGYDRRDISRNTEPRYGYDGSGTSRRPSETRSRAGETRREYSGYRRETERDYIRERSYERRPERKTYSRSYRAEAYRDDYGSASRNYSRNAAPRYDYDRPARRGSDYGYRNAPSRPQPRTDAHRYPPQQRPAAPQPRRDYGRRYENNFTLKGFLDRHPLVLPGIAVLVTVILLVVIFTAAFGRDKHAVQFSPQVTQTPFVSQEPVPTGTPVSTATPEPTMAVPQNLPTMSPDYQVVSGIPDTVQALGLPESARADDSYFNNTVFVGDSVSEKLKYFVTNERKDNPTLLGDAKFLTAPSFSARNALKDVTADSLHPTYQGEKMKLEDVIAKMGVDKVYIMLGLNDVGIHGPDKSAENMMKLLGLIREKSPHVQIFVQSATPRLAGDKPTTEELFEYNLKMYGYILQQADPNIHYVDVAHVVRDDQGKLPMDYCSDADGMALHFNNAACRIWVDYLYNHALVPGVGTTNAV